LNGFARGFANLLTGKSSGGSLWRRARRKGGGRRSGLVAPGCENRALNPLGERSVFEVRVVKNKKVGKPKDLWDRPRKPITAVSKEL